MRLRFDDSVDIDDPLYARYVHLMPGDAGRCPECDDIGIVSSVERPTHVQNQGCRSCGFRWQYRFDPTGRITEVRELAGRRLDLLAPSAGDVDILDLRDEPIAAEPSRSGRGWWRRSTTS